MVIIVFGLPGSGKSFFASRLAAKLGATYISTDVLRFELFPKRTYSDSEKLKVYDHMLKMMVRDISDHATIVLDGTFYKESLRSKFEEEAKKLGDKLIYIEVIASEKKIKERTEKPRISSEANFDVYLKLKQEFEPVRTDHLVLDSSDLNIEAMIDQAIHYIGNYR